MSKMLALISLMLIIVNVRCFISVDVDYLVNSVGEDGYVLVAHSGRSADVDIVDELLGRLPSKVVVRTNNSQVAWKLGKFTACVVLADAPSVLQTFFGAFFRTPSWNSYAKFFVITSSGSLSDYFALAFRVFVLDFVVLSPGGNYGYYPYGDGFCGNYSNVRNVNGGKQKNDGIVGFSKCVVNVATMPDYPPYVINVNAIGDEYPGLDIMILREIAKRLNFTINYVKHDYSYWGMKKLDGTYTGMYSMLMNGRADLMVGMVVANVSYSDDVEATTGYLRETVGFYVPIAKPVKAWKNITLVFSVEIWRLIFASIIFVSIVLWVGGKVSCNKENKSLDNWSFKVICILLNSFNAKPKSRFLKTVLFMWSVYSLLIASMYQGRLISFLTQPAYEHQISTIDEMVNAPKMTYGGFGMVRVMFDDPQNSVFKKIRNNWTYCSLTLACLNRTAFSGDFSVLKATRRIQYIIPTLYTDSNRRPLIYALPPFISYQLVFVFSKGFPIFHRAEQVTMRLRESGLIAKWDRQINPTQHPVAFGEPIVLTLDHLKIAFLILGVGSLIALFVFTIENGLVWVKRKQQELRK